MSEKTDRPVREVYFDHNATTAARQAVVDAMVPWHRERFGNASSLHGPGQEARDAIENARRLVAELINAEPEEIVFTSGGTESDNIAIRGILASLTGKNDNPHVITSSIEHPAVLRTCRQLEQEGVEVTFLPCDRSGLVDPAALEESLRENTAIVSIMMGNNETGSIQPVAALASIAKAHGVLFHTDAVQGVGKIPVDVEALGVDLMSISAHKFYGPKGIGALYVRRGTRIDPLYTGGHQEKALRPGTENVPAIVGFGEACRITATDLPAEMERIGRLRARLEKGILEKVDEVWINSAGSPRTPNTCSVTVTRIEGEAMTLNLGMLGFAMSSGSACATGDADPSHVLLAMGLDQVDAQGALRISLGVDNTEAEIDSFLDVFPGVVKRLRSMSPIVKK